jgi:cytoskeletal protein RodZ
MRKALFIGFCVLIVCCVGFFVIGLLTANREASAPAANTPLPTAVVMPTSTPLPTAMPVEPTNTPLPTDTPAPVEPTDTPTLVAQPTGTPAPANTSAPPLALTVMSVTSPVAPNSDASVVIQTEPGAVCNIGVFYRSGPSEAEGLEQKIAGPDGRCQWVWTVGPNTSAGTYQIELRVDLDGRRNRLNTQFTVQ